MLLLLKRSTLILSGLRRLAECCIPPIRLLVVLRSSFDFLLSVCSIAHNHLPVALADNQRTVWFLRTISKYKPPLWYPDFVNKYTHIIRKLRIVMPCNKFYVIIWFRIITSKAIFCKTLTAQSSFAIVLLYIDSWLYTINLVRVVDIHISTNNVFRIFGKCTNPVKLT